MEKFTCFTGALKDSGFPRRLVFDNKGPENPAGAPGKKPPPKKESFWEEAERKARELNEGASRTLNQAAKAVKGTAAEMPGVVRGYGEAVKDAHARAVDSTSNAIGSVVEGAKAAGRGIARGHEIAVNQLADAMVAVDEGVRGTARAAWETARPVVVVLAGEGYIAVKQVEQWRQGAVNWSADRLVQADGYARFVAQYVQQGVLNKVEIAKKYGNEVANVVADYYNGAVDGTKKAIGAVAEGAKKAGRGIARGHEIAVDEVANAMVAIDTTVRGAGRAAWETARPVVVVLAGEGYIAVKQVEQWRQGAVNWSADRLVQTDGYVRFVAKYVKDGVLDTAAIVKRYGKGVADAVAATYNKAKKRVDEHIAVARAEGERILGGGQPAGPERRRGETAIARAPKAAPPPAIARSEAPATAPAAAVRAPEVENEKIYIVKPGDTVERIANRNYNLAGLTLGEKAAFYKDFQSQYYEGGWKLLTTGKYAGKGSLIVDGKKFRLPKTLQWGGKSFERWI